MLPKVDEGGGAVRSKSDIYIICTYSLDPTHEHLSERGRAQCLASRFADAMVSGLNLDLMYKKLDPGQTSFCKESTRQLGLLKATYLENLAA